MVTGGLEVVVDVRHERLDTSVQVMISPLFKELSVNVGEFMD